MHPEALDWVRVHATGEPVSVLDIGGRDVNGSSRELFLNAKEWTVLDIAEGDNVDVVADAATWEPDREYDVIICTEVFEHTPDWPKILSTAYKACAQGGRIILTMAGPGRQEHSAVDGLTLRPGEYYDNVGPTELRAALSEAGWRDILISSRPSPADTRAVATKEA